MLGAALHTWLTGCLAMKLVTLWTLNTSMLSVNPPQHTRLRRLVSKAFTARKVEQLRGWVADMVDTLLDQLDGGGDFVDTVAFPLPVAVIGSCSASRGRSRRVPAARPRLDHGARRLHPRRPGPRERRRRADRSYLADLVQERRRKPQDDLISGLVPRWNAT
jgi:cytochrome P450